MRMAEEGDHRSMDILVSDIYGGRAHKLGLPNDLIAGSFGKVRNFPLLLFYIKELCQLQNGINSVLKSRFFNHIFTDILFR